MTHGYEPLRLPPEGSKRKAWLAEFLSWGSGWDQGKSLVAQLKARGSIPPEVWGPDTDRQRLAAAMSRIIASSIPWPNAHFIPEDRFRLALFALPDGREDFETTEILMAAEALLGCDLDEMAEGLLEMMFGEVVDALLAKTPHGSGAGDFVPVIRAAAPENCSCPSLVMFLDLRRHVASSFPEIPRQALRPSTKLSDALPRQGVKALDRYVRQRFNKEGFLGESLSTSVLIGAYMGLAAVLLYGFLRLFLVVCGAIDIPDSGIWAWLAFPFEIFGFMLFGGALLALLMVLLVLAMWVLAFPFQLARRAIRLWRCRSLTFADLVRWIVSERAKHVHHPQTAE